METSDDTLRPNHGRIDFERLPNTRDLGGLETVDGRRVRPGVLLRSGALFFADAADLARLRDDYRLRAVIDLRGDEELAELPDPMDELPGASYLHADVLKGAIEGISQDAESRARLEALRTDTEDPARFMETVYLEILLGHSGLAGYAAFLRRVLETTDGSVLWHCHVGRDRCGMASMLVEHILGVPMAAIEDDYLATNLYTDVPSDERTAANLRFLRAAVRAACARYGSLDGYVREGLGLTEADVAELRGRYLA